MNKAEQTRTYTRMESVVFSKTKEAFGGLSNMAAGFPIRVNGIRILTSEALYQVCRFPHLPHVQRLIIAQISPMTAKMKSRQYRDDTRPDWDRVRVKIMRWCLRVKLAQNWDAFGKLLLSTGESAIVEESHKDDFWGAKEIEKNTLVGMNVLGRLLMELREEVKHGNMEQLTRVEPPQLSDFLLYGKPIMVIEGSFHKDFPSIHPSRISELDAKPDRHLIEQAPAFSHVEQPLLFEVTNYEVTPPQREVRSQRFTPYPEYKDSGVPWLEAMPAHWNIKPGLAAYREKQEKNTGMVETTVLSLSYGRLVVKPPEKLHGLVPASFETYQIINPSDIVIRPTDLQNDWTSLRVGLARDRGIITSAYLSLRPTGLMSSEYVYYLLHAYDLKKIFYGLGSGLRQNLDFSDLKRLPVLVPPADEQSAIVRYLDHANRRIDRYIRAKRKLIALLNEQKQVIIQQAVTRGLDPNVRLKPSDVDRLGDVPGHWYVLRLKHVAQVQTGLTLGKRYANISLEEYPYLRVANVQNGFLNLHQVKTVRVPRQDAIGCRLMPGDVLMTEGGDLDKLGRGCIWNGEIPNCLHQNHIFAVRANRNSLLPEFLVLLMTSEYGRNYFQLTGKQTTNLASTNSTTLKNFPLFLPNVEEQQGILEYVAKETSGLQAAIAKAGHEIDLIREYRTRLIADVVTGKIDVREAAQQLPAEVSEPEMLIEVEALAEEDEDAETEELETVAED